MLCTTPTVISGVTPTQKSSANDSGVRDAVTQEVDLGDEPRLDALGLEHERSREQLVGVCARRGSEDE